MDGAGQYDAARASAESEMKQWSKDLVKRVATDKKHCDQLVIAASTLAQVLQAATAQIQEAEEAGASSAAASASSSSSSRRKASATSSGARRKRLRDGEAQLDDMEEALAFQASATDLRLARLAGLKAVTANFNQVLDVDDVGEPLESASKRLHTLTEEHKHTPEQIPGLKQFKKFFTQFAQGVRGEDEVLDGDIAVVDAEIVTIDPISQMRIRDPVRSKVCGHAYDYGSITKAIGRRGQIACPMAGCSKTVSKKDLEVDNRLAAQLRAMS